MCTVYVVHDDFMSNCNLLITGMPWDQAYSSAV